MSCYFYHVLQDMAALTAQFEDSKSQCQSLTLTLQRKEGELSCLTIDLETKGATIVKLQDQLARSNHFHHVLI